MSKRDKLGIHAKIEALALETIRDIIGAALSPKNQKLPSLERARLSLEILKHLVRIEHELKIISEKTYISLEYRIVETSKMVNGWMKYITQTPRL